MSYDQDENVRTNGHWLDDDNDSYESCKQLILASIPNGDINSISNLQVWQVDSENITTRYDRRSSDLNKVSCFVNSADLTFDNTIQNVIQNGFSFKHTNGKMLFTTGILDASIFSSQVKTDFTFILTELAIGKSYVSDDVSKMASLPTGYDSFYIPPLPLDRNKDGEFSLSEYRAAACFDNRDPSQYSHKYVVLDPNQAAPKFLIKFTYHVYKPVMYNKPAYEDVEYFDPILFKHVSAKERKVASTSRLLIPVQHAYEQAVKNLNTNKGTKDIFKTPDPLLEGKSQWINKQFDLIDERIRQVNLNYAEESEKLTKAYNAAVEKLKNLTKEKLETILSSEIELRRDEEHINWINSYMKKQRNEVVDSLESTTLSGAEKNMARINFLKSLHYYSEFKNNWSKLKNAQRDFLAAVGPDVYSIFDVKFIPRIVVGLDLTEKEEKSFVLTSTIANNSNRAKDLSLLIKNTGINQTKKSDVAPTQVPLHSSLKKVIDMKTSQIKESIALAANNRMFPLPPSVMQESSIIPSSGGANYPMPIPFNFIKSNENLKTLNVRKDYESRLFNLVSSNRGVISDADSDATSIISESTLPSKKSIPQKTTPQKKSPASSVRGSSSVRGGKDATTSKAKIETVGVTVTPSNQKQRSMSIVSLQQYTANYKKFSLEVAARRKISQIQSQTNIANIPGLLALQESAILSGRDIENLYFNLPFFSKFPECMLVYSTEKHKRALEELYVRSMKQNGATFFIIKSGQFKFGGYLNQPINLTNGWTGSASCFLFSLSLDLKFPYQSKLKDEEMKVFFGQWEKISIGDGDIVLNQNLETGSSSLENSFGIGLKKGDSQTKCLLAGDFEFTIDALEVWTIF